MKNQLVKNKSKNSQEKNYSIQIFKQKNVQNQNVENNYFSFKSSFNEVKDKEIRRREEEEKEEECNNAKKCLKIKEYFSEGLISTTDVKFKKIEEIEENKIRIGKCSTPPLIKSQLKRIHFSGLNDFHPNLDEDDLQEKLSLSQLEDEEKEKRHRKFGFVSEVSKDTKIPNKENTENENNGGCPIENKKKNELRNFYFREFKINLSNVREKIQKNRVENTEFSFKNNSENEFNLFTNSKSKLNKEEKKEKNGSSSSSKNPFFYLDDTIDYNGNDLPLFISMDESGKYYFPRYFYKEKQKIKPEIVLKQKEKKAIKHYHNKFIKTLPYIKKKVEEKYFNESNMEKIQEVDSKLEYETLISNSE